MYESSTNGLVDLSEEPNGLSGDVRRAPEVDLEKGPRNIYRRGFDLSKGAVGSVVDDNVDMPKLFMSLCKCVCDFLRLGDVEFEYKECGRIVF